MNHRHHSSGHQSNTRSENRGGASFYDFSWGTGEVTVGEKSAAERGAAERGTLRAKIRKCKRGKSCGAACIFARKDCVLDLPVSVQTAINGARKMLMGMAASGEITAEEAERRFLATTGLDKLPNQQANLSRREGEVSASTQASLKATLGKSGSNLEARVREMREAAKQIRRESSSPEEYRRKMKDLLMDSLRYGQAPRERGEKKISEAEKEGMRSPERQQMFKRLEEVYSRAKKGEFKTQQEFDAAMRQAVGDAHYSRKLSDAEVNFFLASLSRPVYNYLLTAGEFSKATQYPEWGSKTPGSRSLLNETDQRLNKADAQRANAFMIARMALETRFTDLYSGQKVALADAGLEHIIPRNVAGTMADIGSNRVLISRGINSAKQDYSFEKTFNPTSGTAFSGKSAAGGGGYSPKRQLIRDIESGISSARNALQAMGSLPASSLSAVDRAQIHSAIIAKLTDLRQSATIGREGREGAANSSSWHWFGGKGPAGWGAAESKALGQRAATKLSEWAEQGPEGTRKIAQFTAAMSAIQQRLVDIGRMVHPESGGRVNDLNMTTNPNVKRFIEGQITATMQESLPVLNSILDQ